MDPHGRDSRYTLEMGDASMFPEMSIMSIDNRTIYSPPEPVAASTVVRSSVNRNNRGKPKEKPPIVEHARPMQPGKQRDYDDPKGSFLDCEPWSAPQGQPNDRVANQGPVACISFSDHCGPGTAYSGQGYPISNRKGSNSEMVLPPHAGGDANRSSLGIIPQEMMQDNSFFNIEDVSSSELMNFGQEARNTHQSNRQQMSGLCSSSKDSHGVDSSSEQTMARSHAMGTVKKQTAAVQSERPQGGGGALSVVQTLLGAGNGLQEGEEAEASICEVQFEDAELADLDDDFSDFGELQFENEPEEVEKETNGHNNYREEEHFPTGAEDWFQYYCTTKQKSTTSDSPVSIAFEDDQLDVNKETCPQQGPLANSDSADTEDELEAVRSAMRQSLNNDRQNGVGSCVEIADDNIRPGLEGGSDHFTDGSSRPNTFVRQSAEGEVVISPVPGDGGGGGDGSSAPGSEDELFVIDGPPVFVRPQDPRPLQVPQDERRIRPVGDETRDSVGMQSMVNQPVLDSFHFKPLEMTHGGIDDLQQVGGGLAEESSYHFEDFLHSSHSEQNQGERLEASGFCQDEDFPFGGRNSLGSFGASPEKDEAQRPALTSNELVYPDLAEANDDKHQDTIGCTDTDNKPVSKIKKTYVSSESPVYIDENGEGVTDLAFQTSLAQEAAFQKHMFEEWGKDLPLEDPLAASMCREQEEFMDRSDALKMLQSDEQQFQEENIFIKDDKMEANPNSGLGDESWLLQTSIYLAQSTRMVDRLHEGDACMRISIGEFMRSRSEALGSLDGDAGIDRPQFGASIITPPTQRAPVALVKEAPCLKVCGTQNSSGTREDGVGYDTQGHQQPSSGDKPMTMEDINLEQNFPSASSEYVSKEQESEVFIASEAASDVPQEVDDLALSTMSRMSEASEMSGMLSLSTITNLISSASPNCKPQDLVNMVLTLSNTKAQEKKGKPESTGRSLETIRERSSVEFEDKSRPKQHTSRLPVRTSSSSSPGDASQAQRKNKSLEVSKTRKTSSSSTAPFNRSQPLGSTDPGFKPDQTVTLKQSRLDGASGLAVNNEGEKLDDEDEEDPDDIFSNGSKPQPDGQESDRGTQRTPSVSGQLATRDTRPQVGGGDFQPATFTKEMNQDDKLKQVNQSPVSPLKASADTSPEKVSKVYSPRLSDIARNMNVDLSKVEPSPDFTLSDYILEGNNRSYSPADGRDTNGEKSTPKADVQCSDAHVFKKPDGLPMRKMGSALANKSAVNKQEKSKLSGVGLNSSRQPETNKARVTVKHGANKENQLSTTNRSTIPDKILENKRLGDKSLTSVLSRTTKQGLKAYKNNVAPQNQLSDQNRPISSKPKSDFGRTGKPTARTKQQNIEVSISSLGHSKELDSNPSPPSTSQGRPLQNQLPTTRPQILSQPQQHPTHVANVVQHQPFTPVPQYSLHQCSRSSNNISQPKPNYPNPCHQAPHATLQHPTLSRTNRLSQPSSGPQSLPSYHKIAASDLHAPKNFSSQPDLDLELCAPTPTKYASLEDQSMLTFDHGLPAYQSTPFYHALSPYNTTDIATQRPETELLMKTPSLAKDFCCTAPDSSKMVELPSVVSFTEVCCVGVSTKAIITLKNTSDHWLECVLDIRELTINEQDVDPVVKLPFMFNQKIIIEPQSRENIPVIFVPKCEGSYVGRMAVLPCTVVKNKRISSQNVQPEFVTLKATAEMPNIEVLSESYLSLVYGELRWGSCKGLPLTLANHGKATVPLRLSISANNSGWHCFSFEETISKDLSIISGSNRPSTPALSKTVLNVTLKANSESDCSSPLPLMVYCKLPQRECTSASLRSPPEVIQAKVDIEVDTPTSKLHVGTVNLHAEAGEVKLLTSIRSELPEINSYGERSTCAFKLQNGGNISMNVSLQPREYTEEIKVIPASLIVKPQEFQEITVVYRPISRLPRLETALLMAIDPDGPVFEVTIIANCLAKVAMPVQPEVQILCNKSHLSFGGVEVGKAGCQRLNVVHQAKTQIKLKLEVTTAVFQIKSVPGHKEALSSVKEVFVNPGEEYSISVAFVPTTLAQFQGKLIIRQDGSSKKYSVPLNGHGGTSNLVLEDSADSSKGGNYFRNIGEIKVGRNNVQRFTLWNIGSRAAFVKVFCFSDLTCSQILSTNVAIVQPNEFVIKADSWKSLVLVMNPSPIQAARCQDKPSVIGAVKFYYGDEINRILYRRELAMKPGMKKNPFPQNHPLAKVNLDVHLQDETDIEEGAELLPNCPNYQATFLKGISRMVLSLVGDPPAPEAPYEDLVGDQHPGKVSHSLVNRNRLAGLSPVTSQDSSQSQMMPHRFTGSPQSEDLDMSVVPSKPIVMAGIELSHNKLHSREGQGKTTQVKHLMNSLEVYPKQLILDLEADGSCNKKGCIQVENMSDVQMSFDVSWPDRRLGVEFDSGILPPRVTCSLYVSPSPVLVSEGISLPWTGRIRVDTQLESQTVSVLVRSVEEKKVSNIESSAFNNHGNARNSQHCAPSKPKTTAANSSKQKSSPQAGVSAQRKAADTNSSQQNSPPVRATSLPGQPTPVDFPDTAPSRRSYNSPTTMQQMTKADNNHQPGKPLGAISKNVTRPSPTHTNKLKKDEQRSKLPSPAEQQVIFNASRVGESTETTFSLSNTTDKSIIWTLSPFTPPFLKIPETGETSSKVQRIKYDVFKFSRTSGDLQPQENIQVFVQFEPQDIGYFSQFWEVRKTNDNGCDQTIDRVQLLGEALPPSSPRVTSLQDHYPQISDTTMSSVSSDRSRQTQPPKDLQNSCVIRLLKDTLEFAAWGTRQTEECKAQIKNKDNVLHRIEIIPPQDPFYLNRTAVKIRAGHFVKLPIEFRPRQIGSYEGIVVFKPDVGQSLSLLLKGTCR